MEQRRKCKLEVDSDRTGNRSCLKAELIPYIRVQVPEQNIHVLVNGTAIDLWSARERRAHQFRTVVPNRLIHSPEVEIRFDLPNASVPRLIGTGADKRKLAILMRSVSLHLLPVYRFRDGYSVRKQW